MGDDFVLGESHPKCFFERDDPSPLGSGHGDPRVQREQSHRQVEAADQRTDAAADRDHAPYARVADGFQRVVDRLPAFAHPRILIEPLLVRGGPHVQRAMCVDGHLVEFRNPRDGNEPLRVRIAAALASQCMRGSTAHDRGITRCEQRHRFFHAVGEDEFRAEGARAGGLAGGEPCPETALGRRGRNGFLLRVGFRVQRAVDLFRSDRQFVDAHSDCVRDRVGDRRGDGIEPDLAQAFRAERAARLVRIGEGDMELRHYRGGGNRVVLEVRVGRRAVVPVEVFDHRKADALGHRALHLTFSSRGMDDCAAIDHRRHLEQFDLAGTRIDLDLHRLRGKVVRARLVAVTAVVGEFRRVIERADADDRLSVGLVDVGAHHRRDGFEIGFRAVAWADFTIDDRQFHCGQIELFRRRFEQLFRGRSCRALHGIARHVGESARQRA